MTEKRVKAWAVVDIDGNISIYDLWETKKDATKHCFKSAGERVVPVTIIVEGE